MKQLRVLQFYLGWASADVPWPAGTVVNVDDTTPVEYKDEYTTVADYLLAVFPERFELVEFTDDSDGADVAEKPKRGRKSKESGQ